MRVLCLALLLLGCKKQTATPPPVAVASTPVAPALDDIMPFLQTVRSGTLDNGFRYFIRKNAKPENRAVFRLAVDAGSLLEDQEQLGLAHFVEHMAFNGTEHYPANDLINYLESIGTRFGADLNAHTSFDETVYKLLVPTDDVAAYDAAYGIFKDWACCVQFADEEIDKERGVVLEEWRRRLGPGQRFWDRVGPKMYQGAPHAERMPIGTEASLRSFERDAARRYYQDWYRPDLMALIVVGDIDVDAAEQKIKEVFSTIQGPESPRKREEFRIELEHERLFDIASDPEATTSTITLLAKHALPQPTTRRDYREHLLERVARGVIAERLNERGRLEDSPYLAARVGTQRFNPEQVADRLSVVFDDGRALDAFRAAMLEVRRLRLHGVLPGELERSKAAILQGYSVSLKEDTTIDSTRRANELVRHFLNGEAVQGVPAEVEMAQEFVPAFTVDEINSWLHAWLRSKAELITLLQVEKKGLELPTQEQIETVLSEVEAMDPEPPVAGVEIDSLVEAAPAPGTIALVDERFVEQGFTGWTFENGIQVWFKDTEFKEDELRMRGWIEGGETGMSEAEWNDGRSATSILGYSGLGPYDAQTLTRFLKDKRAGLSVRSSAYDLRFSGTASSDDLEVQLQRLYLTVTAPRFTEQGLGPLQARWTASIRNRLQNPKTQFSDAWKSLNWPDDPRRRPITLEQINRLDLQKAEAVWTRSMQGIGRGTFVFVGNLPDNFELVVRTWIGSLPAERTGLEKKPRAHRRANGTLSQTLKGGVDEKAMFRMEYWGEPDALAYPTRLPMSATADVLAVLLREKLREELGGVYGVSVRFHWGAYPQPYYRYRIGFTCDPSRIDELENAVLEVLAKASKRIDPAYIEAEIAKNREAHEQRLLTNSYWLSMMAGSLERDEDPGRIEQYDTLNEALTPEIVQEIVRRSFDPDRRATLKMLPGG